MGKQKGGRISMTDKLRNELVRVLVSIVFLLVGNDPLDADETKEIADQFYEALDIDMGNR
jgi:hypothetical protein